MKSFAKVLIANRGAIAVRIIRTLRKMGITSVAVYTKADQDSLHVEMADEAVLIGEGPVKDSYLNAELILNIAIETGAEAIHPGYGFLSENAQFATTCQKHGIVFIGPTPEQIVMFGLKHEAREIAVRAGVPLLPGTPLITSVEEAVTEAKSIGYPVILKSTAGGGGIGMRVCYDEATLVSSYENVRHLAETNFSNGGLFLEKYIARARHVEVQIFGNRDGEVVALGERDCSIQRRNQKVMEETPAPLLPKDLREQMHESARSLALEAGYRSAGTVEFLYDPEAGQYYFLEVNTRLQVEHGVTEEVLGIDLVEWMVLEAANELTELQTRILNQPNGHSLQVRIYAEDCLQNFRPSGGTLDEVVLPEGVRIETWVQKGLIVTPLYDPMLAKIIVHGSDREDAIKKLAFALDKARFYGITTNLSYLRSLIDLKDVQEGYVHTRLLEDFKPEEYALEVIDGGVQSTVQDFPGRIGYWDVGVPPCGPMDTLSFRIGNLLLGNKEDASGLELTLRGGSYRFRSNMKFCITGADMQVQLDDVPVQLYTVVTAHQDQTLTFGEATLGMRTYFLIAGGFDIPKVLGSSSTFTLGGFGGCGGRALRSGDVLGVNKPIGDFPPYDSQSIVLSENARPNLSNHWTVGVIPGPHCTKQFLDPSYLEQLTTTTWEIHFNSSRTGVRLIGPAPKWTREDGGEAGLHPSNIHDNAYAVGTLDLTGDMPILLGPDGPSLGGFVCPVTVASAEFWKLGQLHPGDSLSFQLLTLEDAESMRREQELFLKSIGSGGSQNFALPQLPEEIRVFDSEYPILAKEALDREFSIVIRCAGDRYLLVEYGDLELDLKLRFQVHALMQAIQDDRRLPYIEMTPGIRSLQIHIDPSRITVKEASHYILSLDHALPPLDSITVPSRIVHLPLSWDDPSTQLAIERYQKNVRPDAPWCPSNLEFIRRVNGLDSIMDVRNIVYNAVYLVLGLGDVYLGAPVATPLDPRHRLVTTKYNPARTWTPENAVGIGGAYMCVYGMEGPGGYQFVGRTVQMWNRHRITTNFKEGKPWLLRFFDQIRFYPVTAEELLVLREDFIRGKYEVEITETSFDLGRYLNFLDEIKESADTFKITQQQAFGEERERWKALGLAEYVSDNSQNKTDIEDELPEGVTGVRSSMPGSVWKVLVKPGDIVKKGDSLLIEESMKMEFDQISPCDGIIASLHVSPGDEVHAGQLLVGLKTLVHTEV